jgi:hypothetical protein
MNFTCISCGGHGASPASAPGPARRGHVRCAGQDLGDRQAGSRRHATGGRRGRLCVEGTEVEDEKNKNVRMPHSKMLFYSLYLAYLFRAAHS